VHYALDRDTGTLIIPVRNPGPDFNRDMRLFTGDLDGNLLAFDARNGDELYRFNTGGPIAGGIVTYERKGKQYVAVATGSSSGSIPLTGAATIAIFGQ